MSSDRSERVTLPSRREDANVLSVQFGTAEPIATDVDVGSQVEPTQDPLTTVPDADESFAFSRLLRRRRIDLGNSDAIDEWQFVYAVTVADGSMREMAYAEAKQLRLRACGDEPGWTCSACRITWSMARACICLQCGEPSPADGKELRDAIDARRAQMGKERPQALRGRRIVKGKPAFRAKRRATGVYGVGEAANMDGLVEEEVDGETEATSFWHQRRFDALKHLDSIVSMLTLGHQGIVRDSLRATLQPAAVATVLLLMPRVHVAPATLAPGAQAAASCVEPTISAANADELRVPVIPRVKAHWQALGELPCSSAASFLSELEALCTKRRHALSVVLNNYGVAAELRDPANVLCGLRGVAYVPSSGSEPAHWKAAGASFSLLSDALDAVQPMVAKHAGDNSLSNGTDTSAPSMVLLNSSASSSSAWAKELAMALLQPTNQLIRSGSSGSSDEFACPSVLAFAEAVLVADDFSSTCTGTPAIPTSSTCTDTPAIPTASILARRNTGNDAWAFRDSYADLHAAGRGCRDDDGADLVPGGHGLDSSRHDLPDRSIGIDGCQHGVTSGEALHDGSLQTSVNAELRTCHVPAFASQTSWCCANESRHYAFCRTVRLCTLVSVC